MILEQWQSDDSQRPIDIICRKGEPVVLVGHSGCGKSTLLKTLAGVRTAHTGVICFEGVQYSVSDVMAQSAYRENVAYIPSRQEMPEKRHVSNILEDMAALTVSSSTFEAELKETAILEWQHMSLSMLSDTQFQYLFATLAVLRGAPIVVLDDPMAGLSPYLAKKLFTHIRTHYKDRYLFIATHRPQDFASLPTQLMVLEAS